MSSILPCCRIIFPLSWYFFSLSNFWTSDSISWQQAPFSSWHTSRSFLSKFRLVASLVWSCVRSPQIKVHHTVQYLSLLMSTDFSGVYQSPSVWISICVGLGETGPAFREYVLLLYCLETRLISVDLMVKCISTYLVKLTMYDPLVSSWRWHWILLPLTPASCLCACVCSCKLWRSIFMPY